jgi:hypothetical protein
MTFSWLRLYKYRRIGPSTSIMNTGAIHNMVSQPRLSLGFPPLLATAVVPIFSSTHIALGGFFVQKLFPSTTMGLCRSSGCRGLFFLESTDEKASGCFSPYPRESWMLLDIDLFIIYCATRGSSNCCV